MHYQLDGRFLLCETARGRLGVEVVAPGVLRVFLGAEAQGYASKAVEAGRCEPCDFTAVPENEGVLLCTPQLRLRVNADGLTDLMTAEGAPLSMAYRGSRGTVERGMTSDAADVLAKEGHQLREEGARLPLESLRALRPGDTIYGLGDKTGFLNKRGYTYENWNTDDPSPHEESFHTLYKDFPVFFVSSQTADTYGVFFDNTFRTYFDFGFESPD